MLKYETPDIKIKEIHLESEIAATFTEGSDNETTWLDKWTSGIVGNN